MKGALSLLALLGIASAAAASHPDWIRQQRTARDALHDFHVALPESNLDQLDAIFESVTDPDR